MSSALLEDVVEEILVRLPAKSLLRFKTVSKQWLKLITSNSFVVRQHRIQTLASSRFCSFFVHSNEFINIKSISLSRGGVPRKFLNIDLPPKIAEWQLPVQHVLSPVGYGIYCIFQSSNATFLLWNPTTKQTKFLPPLIDNSSRTHFCHFGVVEYKEGNFSYKVGRVTWKAVPETLDTSLSLELYSSKTKSWKFIPDFKFGSYVRYNFWKSSCVNLNGRAHWEVRSRRNHMQIMTFDYESEVFEIIKTPSPPKETGYHNEEGRIITIFDDKFLCLLLTRGNYYDRYLDVWVMRKYGVEDSWTKKYTVKFDQGVMPIGFSSKLRCVLLHSFRQSPNQILLYDCKSSSIKQFYIPCDREMGHGFMNLLEQDVESLVSILD